MVARVSFARPTSLLPASEYSDLLVGEHLMLNYSNRTSNRIPVISRLVHYEYSRYPNWKQARVLGLTVRELNVDAGLSAER